MKRKILVIDDAADICTSFQERLTIEGYQVWTAPNGRKGLQLYHDHSFDLVITDVLMPELDGLEVVRTLRRFSTTLPIIVMSGGGNRDLDFLMEAKEFGATRTISKPFHPDKLVAMIHTLLSSTTQSSS
ncbi:MAG: response regulator [Nitrospirae bacterium]|nr:response regulator [Nitrospirota bacterium]